MKILGITRACHGEDVLYLKPDSSLLVNRKPFFVPEFSGALVAYPCLVLKVNRLGKNISEKFAGRYFSEVATGYNIRTANDALLSSSQMLSSFAFDYSAVVGEFVEASEMTDAVFTFQNRQLGIEQLICSAAQALHHISEFVTLRMGDMVAIDFLAEPIPLDRELLLTAAYNDKQTLFCRIK